MCKKVLFLREMREELQSHLLQELLDEDIDLFFDRSDIQLHQVDCAIGWRPTVTELEQMTKLKLFINPGAGVQHLIGDISNYLSNRKIPIINGHGNSYFTAQHVVAMYHALSNKILPHHSWMIQGKWRRGDADAASVPIRHKTIGLLGFGAINQQVYRFLSGYDIKFSILKRHWDEEQLNIKENSNINALFEPDELHKFLEAIDDLIIAIPQTSETIGMIGADELKYLSPHTFLVNVGRGSIIDEKALFDVLENKQIAGAAIDVWYNYQPEEREGKRFPYNLPFHTLENVILSPHRAASPFSDLERWNEVIINLKKLARNESNFINQVNPSLGY
ncbi:MAG: hypothetical protein INQ03_04105 [Candidatus Heimdallarchaeota archaeon]|nr:hypothetical protein [Candidatus Heimdallarchaeota archaeon]